MESSRGKKVQDVRDSGLLELPPEDCTAASQQHEHLEETKYGNNSSEENEILYKDGSGHSVDRDKATKCLESLHEEKKWGDTYDRLNSEDDILSTSHVDSGKVGLAQNTQVLKKAGFEKRSEEESKISTKIRNGAKGGVSEEVGSISRKRNSTNVIAPEKSNSDQRGKRVKLSNEASILLRNEHRVADKRKGTGNVQLFASQFDCSDLNKFGRSKRRIKQVVRYDAAPIPYAAELKRQKLAGKTGSGFNCPQCFEHLSYDAKSCYKCFLQCCYVPGTGVVVSRERKKVSTEPLNYADIVEHFKKTEDILPEMKKDAKPEPQCKEGEKAKRKIQTVTTPTSSILENEPASKKRAKNNNLRTKVAETPASNRVSSTRCRSPKLENSKIPNMDNYKLNCDVKECEACLQLFPPTYLNGHRKKMHCLSVFEFACPYCTSSPKFKSMKERSDHIRLNHPGLPICVSEEEKERTKCFVYNCPFCKAALTYSDLRTHLKFEHNSDLNDVLHQVSCTCSFCLSEGKTNVGTFGTIDQLVEHVEMHHKKCLLIGMKLQIGKAALTTKSRGVTPLANPLPSTAQGENAYSTDCKLLSFEKLQEVLHYDRSIAQHSRKFDVMIRKINEKMYRLGQHVQIKSTREGIRLLKVEDRDELEYAEEMKIFYRGVRERQGKAESEKLEKMKYKDKWEEDSRKLQYENRAKKRTAAEMETDKLIYRPIKISSEKVRSEKKNKCCIGASCDLCNGMYARFIITDKEIQDADGDILKAIPVPFSRDENLNIRNPLFRELNDDDDIPDDNDFNEFCGHEEQTRQVSLLTKKNPKRIVPQKNKEKKTEYWKLNELKYSLQFIQDYNDGLLHSGKRGI